MRPIFLLFLAALSLTLYLAPQTPGLAQEPTSAADDGSSEQVEESDEAFRRRMELEDARRRDPAYTPPAGATRPPDEKIDALPAASRENIRDQLLDVIMENGEWEPSDALEDYPYEPTAAARDDTELLKQEQAAWDEQIEKYHQREAEAFGAHRGAAPGPNDPKNGNLQAQGGQAGAGGESGQTGAAGSYQPYVPGQAASSDETSTAGAQQSALEFLRGRQGATGSSAEAAAVQPASGPAAPSETTAAADESASDDASRQARMKGLIAIEDLDKLEGAGGAVMVAPPPDEKDSEDPR